jgi:hypothetical protein
VSADLATGSPVAKCACDVPVALELPADFWSEFRKAFDHRTEGNPTAKRPVQSALADEEMAMLDKYCRAV